MIDGLFLFRLRKPHSQSHSPRVAVGPGFSGQEMPAMVAEMTQTDSFIMWPRLNVWTNTPDLLNACEVES